MFEVWSCSGPKEKEEFFAQADPRRDTWVVSDLQSKWHLQREWLGHHGVLEQSSVMRATELWKQFAFQLRPDLKFVSSELAQTLIWNWVEPKELPWARTPQSVNVIIRQMQMWVSVFADSNYKGVMGEWFQANPSAVERWGHWFVLCSELWEWFKERDLMLTPWLPGWLLNEDLDRLKWDRRILFDLGPQISQVEGQLILQLSRRRDTVVIYPRGSWVALMPDTLKPYEPLLSEPDRGDAAWRPEAKDAYSFGRFSTQLAEVKDAVARVREWLERGIPPAEIGVIAPDIEEYWPVLRLYFAEEGIPVQKPVTAKLGSFVEMSRWISRLRTRLSRIKSADLELSLFGAEEPPPISVSEFRRLFSNVYDDSDLRRAENLFEAKTEMARGARLRLVEFMLWAVKWWPDMAVTERLETLLGVIGQEVPASLELPASEWLSYLEGLLARREVQLEPGVREGIWCVSLSSAHWLKLSHAVFLNLHEGALRTLERSPVSAADARSLLEDTGFALGAQERQQLEFELIWFLQRPWRELRLTFAGSDFLGQVLTPSRIWMWAAVINDQLRHEPEPPRVTRWDEVQRRPVELDGLKRDADGLLNSWGPVAEVKFSASGLSRFWQCPFVFAAERIWRLSGDAPIDLDLDRATRGQLLHSVLEELTVEPMRFDWAEAELAQVVEACRRREDIQIGDERLWPAIRQQHVALARLFLNFEAEWRARFPNTKTLRRELDVRGFWDVKVNAPVKEKTSFPFSGRMDRVDVDSKGRYALIDYKSSANQVTNWSSWLKKHDIQLAFYAMLVQAGFTDLKPGPVDCANYYVVREPSRRKGYHVKTDDAELYDPHENLRNFIGDDEKAALFAELAGEISRALMAVQNGELNPKPEDHKDCERCLWRRQCRAPHLN